MFPVRTSSLYVSGAQKGKEIPGLAFMSGAKRVRSRGCKLETFFKDFIMAKIGIMVCGHGSRSVEATDEFSRLVDGLKTRFPQHPVDYGFLEFATPIIHDGLENLRAQGVDHIIAVPGMLLAAGHVKNDLPSVVNEYAAEHPELKIEFGKDLGVDTRMLVAARQRIEQALEKAESDVSREDTLLMVVGRGTSDPDANSNVSKIARMLWEGMGFGWGEVCYSGVTFPLVAPGLEHAAKLGYKRIVVFPYFLFTGILVKRVYSITDEIIEQYPDIEFIKAGYLNDDELVIDTFADRVNGVLVGDTNMNCQLCKYREQVIGFEAQVGEAQKGHHHHVQGIGTEAESDAHSHDHEHDHKHGHDHDHGHHHTPHPFADHPHGPAKRNPEAVE
jgi:sirohydrochlorin cobaltochelatase